MAEEEQTQLVTLQETFYCDRFKQVIGLIIGVALIFVLACALSLFLYLVKPLPVTFPVGEEWRIQPIVALDQPYHTTPEILQWVSRTLPHVFQYDFQHYNDQLQQASHYFTAEGWRIFTKQLSYYANGETIQADRIFVQATPTSAPFIVNQGLVSGRDGWWVQMSLLLRYVGKTPRTPQPLVLQVLVVRVPTANNLFGVSINNVVV